MAQQGLPEQIYVRCEEIPSFSGTYTQITHKVNNGYPVWKLESGTACFYSLRGAAWGLTNRESGVSLGKVRCWTYAKFDKISSALWRERGLQSRNLTGTVVSCSPNPQLPECNELLWKLQKEVLPTVYVAQRERISQLMSEVHESFGRFALDKHKAEKSCLDKLQYAASGCVAAFLPDLELLVESDRIPANRSCLISNSPFFSAMLKKDNPMQEAASGQVKLPNASAATVRSLLSLLHSRGLSVDALHLTPEKYLDVLSQAAEWECADVVAPLIAKLSDQINEASVDLILRVLQTASMHASSTQSPCWSKLFDLAIERYAGSCAGEFDALLQMPAEIIRRLLACDLLDTKDREGRVLILVAKWAELHGNSELSQMLELVRFPLLPLTSLNADEKTALKNLSKVAGPQVQNLLGEAAFLQASRKRDFASSQSAVQSTPNKRARKRIGSSEIPELGQEEMGMVLCGFLA